MARRKEDEGGSLEHRHFYKKCRPSCLVRPVHKRHWRCNQSDQRMIVAATVSSTPTVKGETSIVQEKDEYRFNIILPRSCPNLPLLAEIVGKILYGITQRTLMVVYHQIIVRLKGHKTFPLTVVGN